MTGKVAILPWGNTIEDFLDTLGMSLESFATEMSGGWLFGYAAALRTAGMDVCIICFSRDAIRPRRLVNPQTGLATIALPAGPLYRRLQAAVGDPDAGPARRWARLLQTPASWLSTPVEPLAKALRDEECTHILCQEYEYHRFDTAARAARSANLKLFATFQGGVPSENRLARTVRRRIVHKADGLIIASAAEVARVRAAYGLPSSRIAQIPNPLDLDEWRPVNREEARGELGVPKSALVAVCHTRIDYRRKGLDVLLEAWRRVTACHPGRDLRLHLIGSGADNVVLQDEIARAPVPGLRWTGYTSDRAAMRRELSAADFYILASRREGFPVAPLEAMACGLPVILSDAPGTVEILPEGEANGGLIVPAGDVAALEAALSQLLSADAERLRLAAAARRRVEDFAAVPAVGARLVEFLQTAGQPSAAL